LIEADRSTASRFHCPERDGLQKGRRLLDARNGLIGIKQARQTDENYF
jgi:hypothetical protein